MRKPVFTITLVLLLFTSISFSDAEIPQIAIITDEEGDVSNPSIDIVELNFINTGNQFAITTLFSETPIINSTIEYSFDFSTFNGDDELYLNLVITIKNNVSLATYNYHQNTTNSVTETASVMTSIDNSALTWQVDAIPELLDVFEDESPDLYYTLFLEVQTLSMKDTMEFDSRSSTNTAQVFDFFFPYGLVPIVLVLLPLTVRYRSNFSSL